jgi:tetratricopeptide (TPR) repeat protein
VNSRLGALSAQEIGALVGLLNQGRAREAEGHARTLLAKHPDAGMVWKILSVALVHQGKDALAELRRASELLPADGEAHRNLATAWRDRGQWTEALASLHRALELQPLDADAFAEAADAMRALGRCVEAVPLYERALLLDPKLVEARNNLGNAFLEMHQNLDAARCYRLAVEAKPDNPVILCNLGNAQRLLGLLEEAKICLQRAIALDSTLNVAHGYLGLVHLALGEREAAVTNFRRAIELNPGDTIALNYLGSVLRDLGRRREAIMAFERAVEVNPSSAESHCHLGEVLFEMRRVDAAMDCYRRALSLQPTYPPAHMSLGVAQRQQRLPSEAEASCRAALDIDPNYVEALSFLGELKADRGEFAQAEELFAKAIAIDPDFYSAFAGIATHRKMTIADAEWRRGVETLLRKRLPLNAEVGLRYALGKYFDDVRQYDDAFEQYAQANELTKRYGATYNRTQFSTLVARVIGRFQPEFIRECQTTASATDLPIIIMGMPRSGTSLAEQILASHPAVFGAGELTFWHGAYRRLEQAAPDGTPDGSLLADMAGNYLERLTALGNGFARVVDKMPANFLYAGLIHAVLPNARIIHMQRHPLDTCLSIYFQNFFNIGPYANDLDNLAHYYREYLRVTAHWRATLPATALLEVPYEALIEDQEGWTRRMLDFVGLPWDPKCLQFHTTDRVVITASKWQVRQKIHGASAGRWRNYEKYLEPLRHLVDQAPYGESPSRQGLP